jgi:signal peptidase
MGIHKKAKLLGKIIFYIIFVLVLLIVVGMFIAKVTDRVFFIGDKALIWVMTDSMEDEIPAESYIQIRKVEPSQIEVDDVITFHSDDPTLRGQLNTHRVVEIVDDGKAFITKGDVNVANDSYPARAEAVVGVHEKNLTVMTSIARFLRSKIGLFLILTVMSLMLVFSFAGDHIKKILKKTDSEGSSDEKK